MNIILFDTPKSRAKLLPLTFTRPEAEMRVGILTISEKWEKRLNAEVSFLVPEYLHAKYPTSYQEINLYISGSVCPNKELTEAILKLENEEGLEINGELVALKSKGKYTFGQTLRATSLQPTEIQCTQIANYWDIFLQNRAEIIADFSLVTKGRKSQPITDPHTIVYGKENIFIEAGAKIKAAILNAEDAPIYIGKNAQIHEGAIIKGAFALGESAHVNMGAKIKGDTTVGKFSKVGGEISNSVIFGYTNKGHDGFLGNSVLGEWCNLGADTNTSNLKNNYSQMKSWCYDRESFIKTEQQFLGLIMGDHTKCSINSMFNTGTVVGVAANIFGAGFPRKFVPSFAWGGAKGFETTRIKDAFEIAQKVMERRNINLTETDKEILTHIQAETLKFRRWEK